MIHALQELSIVVVGRQNPAIISHRFLTDEDIISQEVDTPQPVATPVFSQLSYENFQINVDQARLQIQQKFVPGDHPFVNKIVAKYYRCLQYTPVTAYGINLTGQVDWEGHSGYELFRSATFLRGTEIGETSQDSEWKLGYMFLFRHSPFVVKANIEPPSDEWKSQVAINCHRELGDDKPVDKLVHEMSDIGEPLTFTKDFLNSLLERSVAK